MKAKSILCCALLAAVVISASAQSTGDYRSKASGDWSSAATWEEYNGSAWVAASAAPDSNSGFVTIDSSFTVTISTVVGIDSVNVKGYATLVIDAGAAAFIGYNNDGMGIDVDTLGQVTVNGTIQCYGRVGGAVKSVVFNDGAVYNHARNGGSLPRAQWNTGSTMMLTGVRGNSPSNGSQDFYNLVIDCDSMTANLNLGMTGNTIAGNVMCLSTGNNRYYLTAGGSNTPYRDPITILGDVIVTGGALSSNGSGSKGPVDPIVIKTYGDVIVTGGNFGCSRGSQPSVDWYLYGNMTVMDATLQNSTSSAIAIQQFIFAKQGTQKLTLSNVTYGGGTSPVSMIVKSGTTLDLDTSVITNGNTGTFWLEDSAVLVTNHTADGQGSIRTTADYGPENNFVDVNVTKGTGTVSVQTFSMPHPGTADTLSLKRYWKITADPGITEATLTFYYKDFIPPSEIRGTELNYKAGRYRPATNDWIVSDNNSIDDVFDFLVATGITSVSGEWTLAEASSIPTGVEGPAASDVPRSFFVDQNYPNPFNPSTTIRYGLPKDGFVSVQVYNMLGQHVMTAFEGHQSAGVHELPLHAGQLTSGVYFYKIESGNSSSIKKMMLLK